MDNYKYKYNYIKYKIEYIKYKNKYNNKYNNKNRIQSGGNVNISGPVKVSKCLNSNKTIIIFDDMHVNLSSCENGIDITEYLKKIFEMVKLDFFLEIIIPTDIVDMGRDYDYIGKIRKEFGNQFVNQDKYPLVTFVPFDFRDTNLINLPYWNDINEISVLFDTNTIPDSDPDSIDIVVDEQNAFYQNRKELYDLCKGKLFEFGKNIVENSSYLTRLYLILLSDKNIISNELNKCIYKNKLITFFMRKLNEIYNNYIDGVEYFVQYIYESQDNDNLDVLIATNKNGILEAIDDTISIIFMSTTLLVDLYALSKMLNSVNKNIIIYAGQSHCNNYREFLGEIYFEIKTISENISEQCVTIKEEIF